MTINTIDPSTPDPNDPVGQGDDEIRALKQAIADTFPQTPVSTPTDPWDIPLQVGPREINAITDLATNADLLALDVRVGAAELNINNNISRITILEAFAATAGSAFTSLEDALEAAWPVGSLHISADGLNPSTKGIPGTWNPIGDGQFLRGSVNDFGVSGGNDSNQVTLIEANLPQHKHGHTTYREDSGMQTALLDPVFFTNPARLPASHMAGRDASSAEFTIFNTDFGVNLSPTPDPIDVSPSFVNVRFFERVA